MELRWQNAHVAIYTSYSEQFRPSDGARLIYIAMLYCIRPNNNDFVSYENGIFEIDLVPLNLGMVFTVEPAITMGSPEVQTMTFMK